MMLASEMEEDLRLKEDLLFYTKLKEGISNQLSWDRKNCMRQKLNSGLRNPIVLDKQAFKCYSAKQNRFVVRIVSSK